MGFGNEFGAYRARQCLREVPKRDKVTANDVPQRDREASVARFSRKGIDAKARKAKGAEKSEVFSFQCSAKGEFRLGVLCVLGGLILCLFPLHLSRLCTSARNSNPSFAARRSRQSDMSARIPPDLTYPFLRVGNEPAGHFFILMIEITAGIVCLLLRIPGNGQSMLETITSSPEPGLAGLIQLTAGLVGYIRVLRRVSTFPSGLTIWIALAAESAT